MLLINQSRIQRCYGSAPGDPSFYTLRSFFLSLRYEGAPSTIFHSRGDLIALMTHSSLLEHPYCLMLPVACSSLFHSDHSSYSRFDFLFFARSEERRVGKEFLSRWKRVHFSRC